MQKLDDLEQICGMLQQLQSEITIPSNIKIHIQKALQNRIAEYHLNWYLNGALEQEEKKTNPTDIMRLLSDINNLITNFMEPK